MNPDDGGIGSKADSAIAVARETPGMVAMCVGCVGGGGGGTCYYVVKPSFRHQIFSPANGKADRSRTKCKVNVSRE